jgi:hypothetical protein
MFLSLIAALTLTLAASPIFAADAMKTKAAITTCPAGQTLVKGYTKKDGTKVAAYCRKAAKAKPSTMSSTTKK